MKSQTHAIEGRGLAEIVEYGCVTKPENTTNSPATQPRHKRRSLYCEAAIEVLLTLRQRFPRTFARLNARTRRPLKVGIHIDIQAAMPDLNPIGILRALRFYIGDLRYQQACIEGAARVDLDGNSAGIVTAAQAKSAQHLVAILETKNKQRQERRAQPAPASAPKRLTLADLRAAATRRKLEDKQLGGKNVGGNQCHTLDP
jgi:ProP effector